MMGDYNRFLQLQEAAYNSAGASEQQYKKTLDTLKSKVAIFKDTWDEFTQGIVNQNLIKDIVEIGTAILEAINRLTKFDGILGTVAKTFLGIEAFKHGKNLFTNLIDSAQLAKQASAMGGSFSKTFSESFRNNLKSRSLLANIFTKDELKFDISDKDADFLKPQIETLNDFKNKADRAAIATQNLEKAIQDLEKKKNSKIILDGHEETPNIEELKRFKEEADQEINVGKASTAFKNIYGLNDTQAENATQWLQLGATQDQAASAALAELTFQEQAYAEALKKSSQAEREEAIQQQLNNELNEKGAQTLGEQAKAQVIKDNIINPNRNTFLDDLSGKAEKFKQFSEALKTKDIKNFGDVFNTVFSSAAKNGKTALESLKTSLSSLGTSALDVGKTLLTKLGPSILKFGAIGAGVAAVIGAAYLAFKKFEDISLDNRIEEAAIASEDLSKAFESAKQRSDELASSQAEYQNLQDTLDNLTVGTQEWNNALLEANNQVLELINKFPTLAQYISSDTNGILQISSEGFTELANKQQEQLSNTQGAQIALKATELELEVEKTRKKLNSEFIASVQEKAVGDNTTTITVLKNYKDDLKKLLSEGNLTEDKAEVKQIASDLRKPVDDVISEFVNLSSTLTTAEATYQQYLNTAKNSINSLTDIYTAGTKDIRLKNVVTNRVAEQTLSEDYLEDTANRLRKGVGKYSGVAKELAERDIESSNNQKKDMITLYRELTGETTEAILEQFSDNGKTSGIDNDRISKALAGLIISDETQDKAEKAYDNLHKLTEENQEIIMGFLSSEGETFTGNSIKEVANANSSKIEEYFKEAFKAAEKNGFDGTIDDFVQSLGFDGDLNDAISQAQKNINNAKTQLDSVFDDIKNLVGYKNTEALDFNNRISYIQTDGFLSNATLGAQQEFADIIESTLVESGIQGANSYIDVVEGIYDSLNTDASRNALIEGLSLVDINEIENVNDLTDALEELGIQNRELSEDELKDLSGSLEGLKAVAKRTIVDINEAKSQINAGKAAEDVVETAIENDTSQFSEEDFNKLLAAGVDTEDFFYDGEIYTYLGDMKGLLSTIQQDTTAMREKLLAQLERDVSEGAAVADFYNNNNSIQAQIDDGDTQTYTMESIVAAVLRGQQVTGQDKTQYDAVNILNSLNNYLKQSGQETINTKNMSEAMALQILQSYQDKYGLNGSTYLDNKAEYEQQADIQLGAIEADKSAIENANNYQEATKQLKKYNDLIENNNELTETQQKEYDKWNKVQKKSLQALQAKEKALNITEEQTKDLTIEERAQLVAEKNLANNLKTLSNESEDYFSIIENSSDENDRADAMNNLIDAAKEYLGINLSQEFLSDENNLQLFKKAINGTTQDYRNFIAALNTEDQHALLGIKNDAEAVSAAMNQFGYNFSTTADEVADIANMLDQVSFGIDGTADFTQIFQSLLSLGYSVDQAKQIIEQLAGANVSFTVETETKFVDFPIGAQPEGAVATGRGYVKDGVRYGNYRVTLPKFIGQLNGLDDYQPYTPSTPSSPSGGGGGSSGGGGGSEPEPYDPDYDPFFNTLEKIEKIQEDRNQLEEEYNKILEDESSSLDDIRAANGKIIKNLEQEKQLQDSLSKGRLSELNSLQSQNSDLKKYGWYDSNLQKVQINYDAINRVTDAELGERIDDYISRLSEKADSYNEALQTSIDLEDQIEELRKEGEITLEKTFNISQKIEDSQRRISEIEEERDKIMNSRLNNGTDLLKNYLDYAKEIEKQTPLLEEQQKILQNEFDFEKSQIEKRGFSDYISFSENGNIIVDFEQIENDDLTQDIIDQIENSANKLQDLNQSLIDLDDEIKNNTEKVQELWKEIEDSGLDAFNQVKELLIDYVQDQIDSLSEYSESLNESANNVISAMQDSINKQRQLRENEDTEQSIQDKQQRLAYLRQDTSGANQLEIKQLEEEIAQESEDYTDSLIDQKISELQEQNDQAYKQRQRQIEILQENFNQSQENGAINTEIKDIIKQGFDKENNIIKDSFLSDILENNSDYKGLTDIEKTQYKSDLIKGIANFFLMQKGSSGTPGNINPYQDPQKIALTLPSSFIEQLTNKNGQPLTEDQKKILNQNNNEIKGSIGQLYSTFSTFTDGKTADLLTTTGTQLTSDLIMTKLGWEENGAPKEAIDNAIKEITSGNALSKEQLNNITTSLGYNNNSSEGESVRNQIKGLNNNYNDLIADINGLGLTSEQMKEINSNFSAVANAIDNYGNNLKEMDIVIDHINTAINLTTTVALSEIDLGDFEFDVNGNLKIILPNGTTFTITGLQQDPIDGGIDTSNIGTTYGEMGDLNNDGKITTSEARRILRAAVKLEDLTAYERARADMNGDGKVTTEDARIALRKAIGLDKVSNNTQITENMTASDLVDLIESLIINNGDPKQTTAFSTGGLADFTGPAWLDGTKSNPELVLNAEDTKNFLALKNILSQVMKSNNSISDGKNGDTYYEIHIEVDKLSNDYDVDEVANRIKYLITKDATYRNSTIINRMR